MVEELTLITGAMEKLSGMAFYGFLAYLILGNLLPCVIGWACGLVLVCILSKRICQVIKETVQATSIVRQLRNGLGIGSPGPLFGNEPNKVAAKIPDLLFAYKTQKQK